MAEHGFSQAEIERAAAWYLVALRAAQPLTPHNRDQRHADGIAAFYGAQWLHCRLEHGPGLCEVDCPGEFRHRPD